MTCPVQVRWAIAATLAAMVSAGSGGASMAPTKGLTQAQALARAYDLVYDADFAGADAELARVCGPAPKEACAVIGAASQWWQVYIDLDNHSLDQPFLAHIAGTIADCEKWTAREPDRAEAWFYLGAAYGVRVQYRAQHSEFLSAARDGKRVKGALEKALSIDRDMQDANFGIGMYEYYADIAPTVLKLFRWLLALPGGNKDKGMRQMLQTRNSGILLKSEAAYQLHLINIWYEKNPDGALSLLGELRTRHPHNPLFVWNAAQVHETYRSDRLAALQTYQSLVEGARSGSLKEPELAESWGHLGTADQFEALAESDKAILELRAVVDRRPSKPFGALALAQVAIGRSFDRLGQREQAVEAYRAAQSATPPGDPRQIRKAANDGLTRTPDRGTTEAYRLSLEGWRAFERGATDDAITRLNRAVQLRPDDPVHRYRRGRALAAKGDRAGALVDLERATQLRPAPPAPMLSGAFIECGRLYEAAGDRLRAAASYEWAARVHGADRATTDAATQALARLKR